MLKKCKSARQRQLGVPRSCNVVKDELLKRTLTSSQTEYSRVQIELIGVQN